MKNLVLALVFLPLILNSQIKSHKFISSPEMESEINGYAEGSNGEIYFFDNSDELFVYRNDSVIKLNLSCSFCRVGDIFYEGKDSLLIITEWQGLLRLANNQKSTVNSGLSDYNSICILNNGDIYIGSSISNNKGLGKSTDNGKTFTFTKSSSNGLPSEIIYRIKKDTSGNIWLATFKGLTRLKAGVYKKYLNSKLTENIYDLAISPKNSIWAQPSYGGIAKIDNDQLKDFRNYFPAGVSTNKVAVDSKGYGWTVFDNKLIRISDTDSLEVPLSKFNIDQWICRSLFVDSQDRLWVGMAYRKDILVLQLDYTSKVNEKESEKVLVYPNPAFDRLYVDSDSAIKKIEVYDMQGKIILYAINESAVDIKSLNPGIYIVEVLTQNSKTVRKIVIE